MSETLAPEEHTGLFSEVTGAQWLILLAASAGWVFDIYESQLFTIFKTPALNELLNKNAAAVQWHGNVANAVFLLGGAIGGLGFGILADRLGRVRVMTWTILVYSLFSALTYFVQSVTQLEILRFFVALGTGGEWAVAASLVAETFPTRLRSFASGTFHASSVLGAGIAAITGWIFTDPSSWRQGFLIGILPALLVVWIRLGVREPAHSQTATARPSGSLFELLDNPRWRPRALLGLALASVGLGTYWGIFTWAPELIAELLGPSASPAQKQAAGSRAFLLMNFTGGLLGLLSFAPIAHRFGRKFTFVCYQIGALIFVPVAFLLAQTEAQALVSLPLLAFFVVGMHAGYAIYLPELFPTRLRATGTSFCFNVGRSMVAVLLIIRGYLGAVLGLRLAVVAMASLFAVGLIVICFLPETRGQELPED